MRVILAPFDNPYFYPRPPRGGRRDIRLSQRLGVVISIHALREEGDVSTAVLTALL